MNKNFFAVDLGATSGRTILGTLNDEGLQLTEINRFPNQLERKDGHCYWDIDSLYGHIIEGLQIVAAVPDLELTSIGIDTWGCDVVFVGSDGKFLGHPYAYRDPQTLGAPEAFFERVDRKDVYNRTGIQIMNFNTLFQLDTLRRKEDPMFKAASKILFMPDALSYLLTGQMVTEYTVATTGQLVNARTRQLDELLLSAVGLKPHHFGRFVQPGETIGTLSEEVQRLTGLGPVPVIAVAGHDTASAVAAVPARDAHFAYLSSGTWSLMGIETTAPVINAQSAALNYTNEGGVQGTVRVLKNICGMWLLERCREQWADVSYAQLNAEAAESEPFRSLINPDDPAFANPADMIKAISTYCRKHSEPVPETRGQIVRCIYESLALRYRQVLRGLEQLAPCPISVLHVIGGGSQNGLLNQWTANALGIPVFAGPVEATAMGNVALQALPAGAVTDLAAIRRLVRKSTGIQAYLSENEEEWNKAAARLEA